MLPKQNSYVTTPIGFDRTFQGPLDKYQTFNTVEELIDYAASYYYAYSGQIVSVAGDPVQYRIDGNNNIIPLCDLVTKDASSGYFLIYKSSIGSNTNLNSTSLNRLGNGVDRIYSLLNLLKIVASKTSFFLDVYITKPGSYEQTSFKVNQEHYKTSKNNLCFEYVNDENSIYRLKHGTDSYLILPKNTASEYDIEIYMPISINTWYYRKEN